MDILSEMYHKTVAENERNLRFWTDYLQNLQSLDFSTYSERLKVPVLVPIGSRILFRGELKHTNEVTVALGADYFTKCSLKQADVLRQHRIKVAQEKVDTYNKEKEYLENQMTFTKKNLYEDQGQEIIEYHTVEEDKTWREKHRDNVKEYYKKRGTEKQKEKNDNITDQDLWDRLEELELQEELENELTGEDINLSIHTIKESQQSFVVKDDFNTKVKDTNTQVEKDEVKAEKEIRNKKVTFEETKSEPSKLDLLQQVIDRQNELGEKLHELKNRERGQSKTENDLMSRLDELEQLDELEDEMDRLDDIIENEDTENSEDEPSSKSDPAKLQRRVSFVDEDDSETLELTFKHSTVAPDNNPYDPEKGIQKPSDIYKIHSSVFDKTTSILKKSKYAIDNDIPEVRRPTVIKSTKEASMENEMLAQESYDNVPTQTIVIKDVVEKEGQADTTLETEKKPMSLFKKKRMQNKR